VPILGATVGGIVGSVGGKLIGGVSGIALSKILEVYEKVKESKIKKMSTVSQLMSHLSPQSELIRGLMNVAMDSDEEENISCAIQQAINPSCSSSVALLTDSVRTSCNTTHDQCQAVTQLTDEVFANSSSFDYFVLAPVPDDNAPDEFASSTDLIVLRWPKESAVPWESNGEQVLDIDDSHVNQE
jgi:hypothetical protein